KMKESGCKHLIYGIESGSQRVLSLMRKRFTISDADAVIKATHEAGIVVTANFMFGFPGETEKDFTETLDFIKRNAKYLDRVYPSRTFCALEEFSYLHGHLEEFGVKPNPPNHLYWESQDNTNTYPERLRRCKEFCKLASSLGIEVASGVQTAVELDSWFNMGHYYEHKEDFNNALDCWLKYYEAEPENRIVSEKIIAYSGGIAKHQSGPHIEAEISTRLNKAVASINSGSAHDIMPGKKLKRTGREKSPAIVKAEQRDNSQLNTEEFNSLKVNLRSGPKAFFLQLSGPCNSSCVFCSRGSDYEMFNLEVYRERFEDKLSVFLNRAERIIFTGSGEFLLLPNPKEILDYFDINFQHVHKMFSTNGSGLTPEICEKISSSRSKYTIHVSLHASNSRLHEVMTRMNNFHKILGQLKYLLELRKKTGNPAVHLIFVATTLNIEDFPNFVRLAANLGVDKVICYYNYIYVPAQKYLSCFFKQELTNQMLDEAEDLSNRLNIKIDLPPRFSQKEYANLNICREAWDQIMFNLKGDILPCDASEDCGENLEKVEFGSVWNSRYYHDLRQSLINRSNSCFKYCLRANPQAVNDFRSHVIRRGRTAQEIDILWGDNF
ncbi:MAG: radical SAM protein, partial [Candidatus Omnitrophica bacterium]|nr:radical SAM protein [Candidatus Omnitrophota bacterium]